MEKRKYEVHGTDKNGDIWIVASDNLESAKVIADNFKQEGYTDVRIIENEK